MLIQTLFRFAPSTLHWSLHHLSPMHGITMQLTQLAAFLRSVSETARHNQSPLLVNFDADKAKQHLSFKNTPPPLHPSRISKKPFRRDKNEANIPSSIISLVGKMLAIFSSAVVRAPEELIQASSRTPTPKKTALNLFNSVLHDFPSSVSVNIKSLAQISYTHESESSAQPRAFATKDNIFCLFEGALENLASLRQQYGLGKQANEAVLVMEAYRALRDRAPYPTNHMLGHLVGSFAFIVFDMTTSSIFVASDQDGKVPLFLGVTADGSLAFANNAEMLQGACGNSLAAFPTGCFFSSSTGLASYENPRNKINVIPALEEGMWRTPPRLGDQMKKDQPNRMSCCRVSQMEHESHETVDAVMVLM